MLTDSGPATSATGPACATSPSTPATPDGHRINELERQAVPVGDRLLATFRARTALACSGCR